MSMPQKVRCQVSAVIPHGERVYTLELTPEHPLPRFKPGHFLHLAIDPYDPSEFWPDSRVFSIASSPLERSKISISYAVKGAFTTRMEQELAPGSSVWIKLPYGEFFIDNNHPVVLFAGGTGITAFTAFLNGLTAPLPHPVTLFYGAREQRLLIYKPLVEQCVQTLAGFRAYYFLEQSTSLEKNELPGRTSIAAAWSLIKEPCQSSFYLSGPPVMLQSLSSQLLAQGIPENAIHIDAW